MTLVRWNPTPTSLRREGWDRMVDDLWHRMWNNDSDVVQTVWTPRVDIVENESAYILTADLPGLTREDIDLTLEDGELRISGERRLEREEKDDTVLVMERAHGRFVRSFRLNNAVDTESIKAAFQDGVLTLTLPKVEQKKPRRIQIEG